MGFFFTLFSSLSAKSVKALSFTSLQMAAVAFQAAALVYDHATGNIDVPVAHNFNQYFGIMSINNAAAGIREYKIQQMQMLAFSLCRRNPANNAELDQLFYGQHGITEMSIFQIIAQSVNAGFAHGVVATGNTLADGFSIIRAAQCWAQQNTGVLHALTAASFYQLPALQGALPTRVKISYSFLEEPGTFGLRPVAELIGLAGYVHDAASRNQASRLSICFDTVVTHLATPPVSTQPQAVSRAIVHSGLPPTLAAYPTSLGEQYSHLLLRLHYLAGTQAEQRASFSAYSSLLLRSSAILRDFLQPAASEEQLTSAYSLMVSRIYTSQQPPPVAARFHLETASTLAQQLSLMPEIVLAANSTVPIGDAAYRSQAAATEFDRRRGAVANTGAGGGTGGGVGASNVQASRSLMQQVVQQLLAMPFFGPAEADILRLYQANPANEFPIIKRALETKNALIYQVVTGRLHGVGTASQGMVVVEGVAGSFAKYVDHTTVMDKPPAPTAGARPKNTMAYNNEAFTKVFLSNNREKFLALDFLRTSIIIKSQRDQIPEQSVDMNGGLFCSAENIPLLRYFSHYLDAFELDPSGAGSWNDALTRLEQFRQTGLSLPGQGRVDHFKHCSTIFDILLGELFDALSHFTQSREAPDVRLALSRRIYEVGGAFDQHVAYTNSTTTNLNAILMLHPSFGAAMAGASGAAGGSASGTSAPQPTPSPKKDRDGSNSHRWQSGAFLLFGKGTGGARYDTKLIWPELKKVDSSVNAGNFCMLNYLSVAKLCKLPKHTGGGAFHKVSSELQQLRDSFEHQPFRVDGKAKAAK